MEVTTASCSIESVLPTRYFCRIFIIFAKKVDMRRLLFLVFIFGSVFASAGQTIFAVEEINCDQFDAALADQQRYVFKIPDSVVAENEITGKIITYMRRRIEDMDQSTMDLYDLSAGYDDQLSPHNIMLVEPMGMYWFLMGRLHDIECWCFDARSGEFLGTMLMPFAISPEGIMVSQAGYDCDWALDLHFYGLSNKHINEFAAYMSREYNGLNVQNYFQTSENQISTTSFFLGNSHLYLSTTRPASDELMYLKITLKK